MVCFTTVVTFRNSVNWKDDSSGGYRFSISQDGGEERSLHGKDGQYMQVFAPKHLGD